MSDDRNPIISATGNGQEPPRVGGKGMTVKVPLDVPVTHGDQILNEIEVRELTFDEMERLRLAKPAEQNRLAFQLHTGLPPSVIKQLRQRDTNRIIRATLQFSGEEDVQPIGGSG